MSKRPHKSPGRHPALPGTSWEHVAAWYDRLVGEEGNDYQRNVVLPAAIQMLDLKPDHRVLDLCCGTGVLCRQLAALGIMKVVGVDISEAMIRAAKSRTTNPWPRYVQADVCNLGARADGSFDRAACLMAVHDVDNLTALFTNLSASLKSGGLAVLIMMHPCFRFPRQSSWGWDEKLKTQYRRMDRYLTPLTVPIAMHPGSDPTQRTVFFHRPLAEYITTLGTAGLAVTECRELVSHRTSEPGGRSRAENRSRSEFPIFLALKAIKFR